METENHLKGAAASPEVNVSCRTGLLRQKIKVLTVRLTAPKEMFLLPDALSKHGTFPSVEDFVTGKVRSLVSEYLGRAEEVVAKASELSKSPKNHK